MSVLRRTGVDDLALNRATFHAALVGNRDQVSNAVLKKVALLALNFNALSRTAESAVKDFVGRRHARRRRRLRVVHDLAQQADSVWRERHRCLAYLGRHLESRVGGAGQPKRAADLFERINLASALSRVMDNHDSDVELARERLKPLNRVVVRLVLVIVPASGWAKHRQNVNDYEARVLGGRNPLADPLNAALTPVEAISLLGLSRSRDTPQHVLQPGVSK